MVVILLIGYPSESISLPNTWSKMAEEELYRVDPVAPTSKEYTHVVATFDESMKRQSATYKAIEKVSLSYYFKLEKLIVAFRFIWGMFSAYCRPHSHAG